MPKVFLDRFSAEQNLVEKSLTYYELQRSLSFHYVGAKAGYCADNKYYGQVGWNLEFEVICG